MTIEQTGVIDMLAFTEELADVKLIISDHLDWVEPSGTHLLLLQEKINTYLRFIEGGEIYSKYPELRGRPITIRVVGKYGLSDAAMAFFATASEILASSGFKLEFEHATEE